MTNDIIKAADALAEHVEATAEWMASNGYDEQPDRYALADYREACSAHDDELTRLREQVETLYEALVWIESGHLFAHRDNIGRVAHKALENTK